MYRACRQGDFNPLFLKSVQNSLPQLALHRILICEPADLEAQRKVERRRAKAGNECHRWRGARQQAFKTVRNSDDDWNIVAEYRGAEPREITGLASKADVDDWMNGERRIAWLRSQGYAK